MINLWGVLLLASVAFFAVVLVALGKKYRWWKREGEDARRRLEVEKVESYQTLWGLVRDVETKLMEESFPLAKVSEMLEKANSFMHAHARHIGADDRELVNQYLQALYGVNSVIADRTDELEMSRATETSALPRDVRLRLREIGIAENEVRTLRENLNERFRKVVGETID